MKRLFFSFVLLQFIPFDVRADSWEERIRLTEEEASVLFREALNEGSGYLGSAYNEIGVPTHTCTIAAELLSVELPLGAASPMEKAFDGGASQGDAAYNQLIYSQWLFNWANTARALIELSNSELVTLWNLECPGNLGIPENFRIDPGNSGAAFEIEGNRLRVIGNIEEGFSIELFEVLVENPQVSLVELGSGGGRVYEAILAGQIIRQLGLDTTLYASCFSACPLVFMGGKNRTIWSPYPTLGFHQISTNGGVPISAEHPVYADVARFVAAMGVSDTFVLEAMHSSLPHEMNYPSFPSLCEGNVATWIQRTC